MTELIKQTESIPRQLAIQLLSEAQQSPHREICGLIGKTESKTGTGKFSHYSIKNSAEKPEFRFAMEPEQQIAAMRIMREHGETLFAIYHSHPQGEATPSKTDLEQAAYPNALYLILAPNRNGVLEMRGFCLKNNKFLEVTLEITTAIIPYNRELSIDEIKKAH